MKWLKGILEEAVIVEGTLDVETLMEKICREFPKHAIPKAEYNKVTQQLKTAKKTIDGLKKESQESEALWEIMKAIKQLKVKER